MDILSCIQRKLTTFIIFTFILFLFFWYFISAFCAVYQNTQKIYLRDSMISFAISLIDPFFIYCFTSLLRCISLKRICRKKCCGKCLYKTSGYHSHFLSIEIEINYYICNFIKFYYLYVICYVLSYRSACLDYIGIINI